MSGASCKQRHSCFVFQIMKRNLNNVKRMTSHPVYQYCKCPFQTCSSPLPSPHPLSDAQNSVLSVCCLTFLSMHVDILQIWRGLRTAVSGCLNGRDLSSSFVSDKQATRESHVCISTPRETRCTHARTHAQGLFCLFVQLHWFTCIVLVVWSCWRRGLPQSVAGQPDIVQP